MVLLTINTTDVTAYIDKQNYNMNVADVFEEWVDGNHITHRVVTRQRRSGTVMAGFKSSTDLNTFLSTLSNAKTSGGYYPITAYINNTNASDTFNAFIDFTTTAKWDWLNDREWHSVTLTITEI